MDHSKSIFVPNATNNFHGETLYSDTFATSTLAHSYAQHVTKHSKTIIV